MTRDEAQRLASGATRADIRLLRHEPQLAVSLMSLLPTIDASAPRAGDEAPGLHALDGTAFYEVSVADHVIGPARDPVSEITVTTRRFDPAVATASVSEHSSVGGGGSIIRKRAWKFTLAPDWELAYDTEQTMRGGFETERQPSEVETFARALARSIGHAVPENDLGQGQY